MHRKEKKKDVRLISASKNNENESASGLVGSFRSMD